MTTTTNTITHFGVDADTLIGDRCTDLKDGERWATDLSLVTCRCCQDQASKVLRWAMNNPTRVPKATRSHGFTVAF